ncbi:MAG: hypothetical protein ACLP2X_13425, partial [Syntrophobacteraceae bacterium]
MSPFSRCSGIVCAISKNFAIQVKVQELGNEQLTKNYIYLYSIELYSIRINLNERHMQWRLIFMT